VKNKITDYFYIIITVLPYQIQMGMVVYVCFFNGATEEVTYEMGELAAGRTLFHNHNHIKINDY